MKKYFLLTLILILTIFATSCDCLQNVSGSIVDTDTKLPLDSVYVSNANNGSDFEYSDDKGNFKLSSISGGLCGCPPMSITLTRSGYEPAAIKVKKADHIIIYMMKKK